MHSFRKEQEVNGIGFVHPHVVNEGLFVDTFGSLLKHK
jgi:hypothetical protein